MLWLVAGSGCATSQPVEVDPASWTLLLADEDPLADHRPADDACPASAWGPEFDGFEVQTGICHYGAFSADPPTRLRRGDRVWFSFWHDALDAAEPATAHVAVLLGDAILWERQVQIPGPSSALEAEVELDHTPDGDAAFGLHLHNHGYNSWRLVGLSVGE